MKNIFYSIIILTIIFLSNAKVQAQPPAPTNFTSGTTTTSTVVLNWTPSNGGEDGFRIVWKPGNTAPSTNTDGGYHNVSGGSSNTYTVTGLQAGQQYTFAIYATQLNFFSLTAPTVTITTNNYSSTTFINEQAASLILGQNAVEDISNTNAGGLSASSMYAPYDVFVLPGAAMNSEGKVFVADKSNNRVLIFNSMPTSNKQLADVVIGQSDFTSNGSGSGANQLNNPAGVVSDGTRLFIADEGNNRILVFNTIPVTNGASANIVLGQTTFGAGHTAPNNGGRSASTLYFNNGSSYGTGLALYSSGFTNKLIVCDGANDRVLIWDDYTSLTNGKAADHVIGQANFTANSQPNANSSTAATLYSPKDVAVTSTGKLFILSRLEHRVLIYNSIPTSNGASADNVLGQTNFANNQPSFTNTASGFYFPRCLAVSTLDDRLCVAGSGNRVMVWNTIPATDNADADLVLGFPDLTSSFRTMFSNENNGSSSNMATNLSFVDGISWTDAGNLLCADASRNAVLKFNGGAGILTSPSSVTAGTVTKNSVQINWSGSSAMYYQISYKYGNTPPASYDDPTIVASLDGVAGNTYTLEQVPCGTQFSFAVFAKKTQFGSQYAPVNGTLSVSSGSTSCVNFPIFENGSVYNITPSITGDTIFCAGSFSKVYSKTGTAYTRRGLCAIDGATGNLLNWVCDVGTNQSVNQVLVNKVNGKLYVGGSFTTINGVTRTGGLAALNSDGSVYTSFNPFDNNGGIGSGQGGTCMTFNSTNDTLFFWGPFTSFNSGGVNRDNMAAVLCSDGSLTDFAPAGSNIINTATCRLFALSPNGKSIITGSNNTGKELRSINIATGSEAGEFDWQTSGGLAACLWYDGSKYLYIGGSFDNFMGQNNVRKLAKVDMSGTTPTLVTDWNNTAATRPSATVRQISGTSSTLILAGDFSNIGGTERIAFGAVNITDCSLNSFNPGIQNNTGGAKVALGASVKNGIAYMCSVGGGNNSFFSAAEFSLPPSISNGSASGSVGAGSTVTFSNTGGVLARLITNTSNLGNTTVTVSGAGGDTTVINGYTVLDRVITITPTTQPTDNVTVHFYVTKAEMDYFSSIHMGFGNSGNNYSGCKVHRLGAGNAYVQTFTPTITINGDIVDVAFDTPGFSSFALSDDGLLPVELASFTSLVNKNNVTLNWKTVSEENNSGFDVERKSIEGNWSKIGFMQGKGNSSVEVSYKFEDRNVSSGEYKYRLKQIDFNGNYKYYDLVNSVAVGIPTKWDLSQNYPNPFNPATKINYDIPKESFVKINIYDVTGRMITSLVNEKKTAGYFTVEFNASAFSSGVYFYRIETESFTQTKKMMLVK